MVASLSPTGRYIVTCHVQGDAITMNDAAWCLPYLSDSHAVEAEAK